MVKDYNPSSSHLSSLRPSLLFLAFLPFSAPLFRSGLPLPLRYEPPVYREGSPPDPRVIPPVARGA
ncbi:hypothetical protein TNIN_34241, partial [Trichonephila inaurata madagascariensis]